VIFFQKTGTNLVVYSLGELQSVDGYFHPMVL